MLIDSKEGQDIFEGQEDIIVFAINAEGVNDSGFAGIVSRRGWPELANMGECQIGDVFEKEIDGKRYCGIVCHTLSKIDGWGTPEEQTRVIREAFNKIETRPGDIISSIAIGNGLIGKMSGSNYEAIVRGMHESDKDIVLYGKIPEKIMLKVESEKDEIEELDIDEETKAKIPSWIERGKAIVYPEKLEEWENCVNIRANDLYHGWDLENALEIMEKLQNDGTMEEAKQIFEDANHSGASAGMVRSMVLAFSRKGPDFYEETSFRELSEEEKNVLDVKRKENAELDNKYKKEGKEEMPDYIQKLLEIKKDELTEREFYENVLQIIKDAKESNISLTEDEAELLKNTLLSIGCKKYSDWKAEKDAKGEEVIEGDVGSGIEVGHVGTAVTFVHQLLGTYSNANYSLELMLDGGEENGWVQKWLRNSKQLHEVEKEEMNIEEPKVEKEEMNIEEPKVDKLKIPYYQVAKEALMNWNGLTEEEAIKVIQTSSFDEIENQVWAKSSMMHAVEGISKSINLSKEDEDALKNFVLTGEVESEVLERAREGIVDKVPVYVLMDSLKEVHNGWVEENEKKFMAREKKHQHMPFELIGWNEAKADLLFANPIFLGIGVGISRPLEYDYLDVVKDYLLENKIVTTNDLVSKISKPEEFYPSLKGQTSITENLKDEGYVRSTVIPQIEEKGIGKIEDVRKDVLNRIANNPQEEDLERVTPEEREYIAEYLDREIEEKNKAIEELKRKNEIIGRIKEKSNKLKELRKTYTLEELASMRNNDDNK